MDRPLILIPCDRPSSLSSFHCRIDDENNSRKVNDYKFQVKRDSSWTIKHYYYLNETMKH